MISPVEGSVIKGGDLDEDEQSRVEASELIVFILDVDGVMGSQLWRVVIGITTNEAAELVTTVVLQLVLAEGVTTICCADVFQRTHTPVTRLDLPTARSIWCRPEAEGSRTEEAEVM